LLACALAKAHQPSLDIRKPYTKIGADDAYSGRDYDETWIWPFASRHRLPCNQTTAFLTPAFRNRNIVLTPDVDLVGRPPELYQAFLQLLDDIHRGRVTSETILAEVIRRLVAQRDEQESRLSELLQRMGADSGGAELPAEAIVKLVEHHLSMPGASRLPVLVVAAAYRAAERSLGERVLPFHAHNAADRQTGALGDLEIALLDDARRVTVYEMKNRSVTTEDIDTALFKIAQQSDVDNYIFITTSPIEPSVSDYAAKAYSRSGGVEIVVPDCVSFLRHFLHLFYRLRTAFLDAYQQFVLNEPDNAVRPPLKEALLLLRAAAEQACQ